MTLTFFSALLRQAAALLPSRELKFVFSFLLQIMNSAAKQFRKTLTVIFINGKLPPLQP
jgi:hypothetical protein